MSLFDVAALEQWQSFQPVSVLALDLADRAVLRVAGRTWAGDFCIKYYILASTKVDLNFRWTLTFVIVSLWQHSIIKTIFLRNSGWLPPRNKVKYP